MADFHSATATVSGSPVVPFPMGTIDNNNGTTSKPKPVTPVPPSAPCDFPLDIPSWKERRPSVFWLIEDAQGRLLGLTVRFDLADGKKDVVPLTYCRSHDGAEEWRWQGFPEPRPLYGLPDLATRPNAPVLVVEGEKKVDPAKSFFPDHVAVSQIGGGKSANQTDWSPLAGRRVTIWPDNDQTGRNFAEAAAQGALDAGADVVCIVDVPDSFPEKWDLADPLPDRVTVDDLRRTFSNARAYAPQLPRRLMLLVDTTALTTANSLVKGLLGKGSVSVLYGDSNVGKTFLACDLALHVALGWDWFGRHVEQSGVIYLAAEGGYGIRNRVAAFKTRHGVANAPFAIDTSAIDLCDPEADTAALIETVRGAKHVLGRPVGLVVIDTLSRALAGGNENDPKDMGALVKNVDRIKAATGAHVLLIHHSGKDATKGARGHSLLRAAVDTEFEVTREGGGAIATVTVRKQRDLPPGNGIVFRLDAVSLGLDEDGDPVTSCVVVPEQGPVAGKAVKLTRMQRLAHDKLVDCLAECGQTIPNQRDIPPVPVVRLNQWRERLKMTGVTDRDNPDCERSQWSRIRKELLERAVIGIFDDFVWLTKLCETARDIPETSRAERPRRETPPLRGVSHVSPGPNHGGRGGGEGAEAPLGWGEDI